jgi:predicted transcriptional regulator
VRFLRSTGGLRQAGLTDRFAAVSTKEIAIQSIQGLPDDASWEDIQERINFIASVRKGLRELDEGKGIPHDRVREEFAQWLTD